jgi:hypothetical protein
MKKTASLTFVLTGFILATCDYKQNKQIERDTLTLQKKDTQPTCSRYVEIIQDIAPDTCVQVFSNEDIARFYGEWEVKAIAYMGGSLQTEESVFSNIGKRTAIGKNLFIKNLRIEDEDISDTLKRPRYGITLQDWDDLPTIKMYTIYYGYRSCRKNAYTLEVISTQDKRHFYYEIVDLNEIGYYYDGRFYFLKRI